MAFTASSRFYVVVKPGPLLYFIMEEKQLLELIESRTKKLHKNYKLLEATLYPKKRKPKKRKIKRLKKC